MAPFIVIKIFLTTILDVENNELFVYRSVITHMQTLKWQYLKNVGKKSIVGSRGSENDEQLWAYWERLH